MKKSKYYLTLISMAIALSAHAENEVSTLDKIKDTHTLTLGIRESAAPFASIKNGVAKGFSVDICNSVVSGLEKVLKQKIDVKYVPVNGGNRIELIKSGRIDMECGTTTDTKAREQEVAFSYPIFVSGTRLAVRSDSTIFDYANLEGARVAVVQGSSCSKLIESVLLTTKARGNPLRVITVKDNDVGVNAVANSVADAFCTDDVLLAGTIAENGLDKKLHRVSRLLSVEPYAIMLRKNDDDFLHLVDSILADQISSGKVMKDGKKWFDNESFNYKFNHMTISALTFPVKFPVD